MASQLAIMDPTGDTKIMWDPDDEVSAAIAEAAFEAAQKKGYMAYAVEGNGDSGEVITKFDAEEGRMIIMKPPMAGG